MDNKPGFVSEFIELYRGFPCLWKVKDESYSNKKLKDEAYGVLLAYYKKTIPSATVDFVKKKINNLRSSFRKELKKVLQSARSGSSADEVYVSSLWYYDLMVFSADQEVSRSSIGSDEPLVEETLPFSDQHSPSPSLSFPNARPDSALSCQSTSSSKSSKRRNAHQSQTFNAALNALKEDDEFDGIGINVACKLRRMGEEQRMIAETIINKTLFHGLKGRLLDLTDLTPLNWARPQPQVVHQPPQDVKRHEVNQPILKEHDYSSSVVEEDNFTSSVEIVMQEGDEFPQYFAV